MYSIERYDQSMEPALMALIELEGEDWRVYWDEPNATKYRAALLSSVTYVALKDGELCGYLRALPDALYIYVCDLLVTAAHRGNSLVERMTRRLMEDYPDKPAYLMSGNDGYYERIGYSREGSVYLAK